MKFLRIASYFIIFTALFACKDTANTSIKEDNQAEGLEASTPVLKEQWKENQNDWSQGDDRASLKTVISNNSGFNSFVKAMTSAEMFTGLDTLERATLFIPTNRVFENLNDTLLAALKTVEGEARMAEILSYHIVPEEYDRNTLMSTIRLNEGVLRLQTLQGAYIALSVKNDSLMLTDEMGRIATIHSPNMAASNGVIHGIDRLLVPQ